VTELAESAPTTPPRTIAAGVDIVRAIWRHPGNRGRRLRAVGTFVLWQAFKRVIRRPLVVAFHNRRLKCYPDSTSTSGVLYFSGYPDYWEMKFLQAYLREGDNFIDVGANTGVYSILASGSIGSQGHIDAFEPMERTAARIEEQAALNRLESLHVHRFAISDRAGELDFGFAVSDAMMHLRRADEASRDTTRVTSTTLDLFEPYRHYAAGKMDIEGAEPMALAGAACRLRDANPPVWLLELAGYSNCYGVSSAEVVQRLAQSGYACAVYHPHSGELEFTDRPWLLGVQNVLAIAESQRHFVQDRLRESAARMP
jgi:FkbM family methyltransferase